MSQNEKIKQELMKTFQEIASKTPNMEQFNRMSVDLALMSQQEMLKQIQQKEQEQQETQEETFPKLPQIIQEKYLEQLRTQLSVSQKELDKLMGQPQIPKNRRERRQREKLRRRKKFQ